jgi:predicted transcriptional regulator
MYLLLTIHHGQNNIIAITLDPKEKKNRQRNAHLDIIFQTTKDSVEIKKSFTLATERHKNKTSIYTLKRTPITARYLDVTLKPKVEKVISDKRKQFEGAVSELRKQGGDYYPPPKISDIALAEYFADIKEMRDNRENWRYSLNLRGLLLYLFHETQSMDKRKAKNRIRDVISNPVIIKKAPFLNFWWYFEKAGFNAVDLLLDISLEYINQLHIDAEQDNYLIRRITERFFVELENIFHRFSDPAFSAYLIKKICVEEYNEILEKSNEYREIIISYQKDWIRKQQEVVDYTDKKCKSFKLEKELHNTLDALAYDDNNGIISIDKLAQKYGMSSNDIHDFIFFTLLHGRKENNRTGSHYYNYKDKQYLVAGSHLISRRKLDKLKGLLFDRMDIKDAYLTLHKHDIPESCRYELIHKLGFWVSTNSEYSGGGYIVRTPNRDTP